jgi:hypothetical protein
VRAHELPGSKGLGNILNVTGPIRVSSHNACSVMREPSACQRQLKADPPLWQVAEVKGDPPALSDQGEQLSE